jgi:glycogenin glucosyltransferase
MEKYIRNIMVSMSEKAKDQSDISPIDRRESLIFTGLPALEDRPSLPVTPAPIMTTPFWADGQNTGEEEISGQSEGLSEQAEWVCPQCGFSSHDASVFTALSSSTLPGLAVFNSPAIHRTAVPDKPESSEPINVTPPDSTRPMPLQRESSSEISAISGASTVVTQEREVAVESPTPPPKQPAPLQEPLLPPAWLTAAIADDDNEFDEEEADSSPTPDSSSVHAISQELTAC